MARKNSCHLPGPNVARDMDAIHFRLRSRKPPAFALTAYPGVRVRKRWLQRWLDIIRVRMPRTMDYLERQRIMSHLGRYRLYIYYSLAEEMDVKSVFLSWLKREKNRRLAWTAGLGLALPFTGILAFLPGPNVFFYLPALLFYLHGRAFVALQRQDWRKLDIHLVGERS